MAAACKKEERLVKGTEEGNSSAPKSISKASKRKSDGDDVCPSKKTVAIPGDASPKGKSSLKPSHSAGKGVMTSSGPILEGPGCFLTHKAYAVREVGSFMKPMDLEPCDLLGTEDLGVSAFFDINLVLFPSYLTDVCAFLFFRPWFESRLFRIVALLRRGSSLGLGNIMQL